MSREIDIIKRKIKHEEDRMKKLTDQVMIDKCKSNIKQYENMIEKIKKKKGDGNGDPEDV